MSVEDILKKLISFRTVTGNHTEVFRAFEWIKDTLSPVPLYVREHVHNGFPSLVVTTQNTNAPTLWLSAHIDVVPADDAQFIATEKEGKIFGRGAFDMKCAIASFMHTLLSLGVDAQKYSIGMMITSDEEIGGFDGVKALLEKDGYRGECALIPDGGGEWLFEEHAKGMIRVRLTAKGTSAHGSRPWHGENAITKLFPVISALEHFFISLRGGVDEQGDDTHWHSTMSLTALHGGVAHNQIPDVAEAVLDIRVIDEADREVIISMLQKVTHAHEGVHYEILFDEAPYGVSRENNFITLFSASARECGGIEMGWTRSHGASDARHFAQKGIATILTLPRAGGAHSEQEWVDTADLLRFTEVVKHFVCSSSPCTKK